MSFLKTVEKKWKVSAADGPDSKAAPSGASSPENWVSKLQTGRTPQELKEDVHKFHSFVSLWQDTALEAHHIFVALCANGGKSFEMFSPTILKGMSREKLMYISEICSKLALQAPII